eukprot:6184309-Pleurochrysis_carterae.AAC.7
MLVVRLPASATSQASVASAVLIGLGERAKREERCGQDGSQGKACNEGLRAGAGNSRGQGGQEKRSREEHMERERGRAHAL